MIESQILLNPEEIISYRNEWEQVYLQAHNEPSSSFSWTYALFQNHIRAQDQFFLIRFTQNKQAIAFLPMLATKEKLLGLPLITIYPISERYNTHSDLLNALASDLLTPALVDSLKKIPLKWDIFRTTRFLETHPVIKQGKPLLKKQFSFLFNRYEQPSFFLPLPSTYEQYLAQRSSKFRNYLGRMNKKLAKHGDIEFIKLSENDDFSTAFEKIMLIEKASWKHEHGTAISAIARQERFYHTLCKLEHEKGRLHLTFLNVDEQPIAYNMGLVHNNTYYYLKTSYNDTFRKCSPSTILRADLIQMLIEKEPTVTLFDFPGEPYQWEEQWTTELQWHQSIVVFNTTLKARLIALLSLLRRVASRQKNEKQLQYVDPRNLTAPTE